MCKERIGEARAECLRQMVISEARLRVLIETMGLGQCQYSMVQEMVLAELTKQSRVVWG